jgi:2'-5' RNA ligase
MQEHKRLFIGTFVKADKLLQLYPTIVSEFSGILNGKWVEQWNLHFTYHFLGEVPTSMIPELLKEINPFLTEYPDTISLNGLGCFPNQYKPRVLFVNLFCADNLLEKLQNDMRNALSKLKFDLDERPFHPHLTLARIKYAQRTAFIEKLEKYRKADFGQICPFRIELIESKLTSSGPLYRPLSSSH